MSQQKPPTTFSESLAPFVNGGLAGMAATCIVQPIDLIKTRMQLSGERGAARAYNNSFVAIQHIARAEGVLALYTGLSAGLLRQATYTTTRLGVYQMIMDYVAPNDGSAIPFYSKLVCGMAAGGIGAFVGTPAEVTLIRMTADGRLPPAERRGYKNAFEALSRMAKEEGVLSWWKGCSPTVARAMVLNAAQLGCYSQAKQMLIKSGYFTDNIFSHAIASLISGFVCTAVSMPIDMTKTRLQNMKIINGKPQYSGIYDVVSTVVTKEGFFSLWKGFTPYFLRLGPHTIFTFIFLEKLNYFVLGKSMK